MGGYDIRPSLRRVALLSTMASTASAISLSIFDPIVPSTVPISCILAYNTEIPGCTISDFVEGNTCSPECVRGLTRIQRNVEAVCDGVDAPLTTVLGQVLAGNLVELLCPGASSPDRRTSTTSSSRSSTRAATGTRRTSSSVPALTFTTVRPPTTAPTTAISTSTEDPVVETTTSPPDPPDSPLPTPPPSSSTPTSSTTSSSARRTPTFGESGGGSPFDVLVLSDSRRVSARWAEAMLVGLAVGLILLR